MYARKDFFEQVIRVMRENGRTAPIFVDKHFSYDLPSALWMYNTARARLDILLVLP